MVKMLFHQLLIFSCFTDSAAGITLLGMDILCIEIEINLSHSGRQCVCVDRTCVGGMGGICGAWMALLKQHKVLLMDSPGQQNENTTFQLCARLSATFWTAICHS